MSGRDEIALNLRHFVSEEIRNLDSGPKMSASGNSSQGNIIIEDEKEIIFKNILYIIDGIMLIVTNMLIVASILRHRLLRERKEYIIVAGKYFNPCLCDLRPSITDRIYSNRSACASIFRLIRQGAGSLPKEKNIRGT
jgi:hypothetical protein